MIRLNNLASIDNDFTYCCNACDGRGGYISPDPRLVSAGHNGVRMQLNEPPLNGNVSSQSVYKEKCGYEPFYSSYSQMKGGQNKYYIDPSLAKPFISEIFSSGPSAVYQDMYIDPMGTTKPHYYREKLDKNSGFCLSWLRDSTNHREDLLARQLWKRNQSNYETIKMLNLID